MQTKKGLSFFGIIVALIVGAALYREYDPAAGAFKNTGLAIIYFITFVFAVFLLIRGYSKRTEK
ncbi:MAG: hypothetical protein KGZ74_04120 [Chitinophagaceae bacterium]|jgi:positive regulator of sigma E activity|nr:hypothetical protein [Chitinophagaceae bacterium]